VALFSFAWVSWVWVVSEGERDDFAEPEAADDHQDDGGADH
jgi:hypothetical protein